MAIQQTAHDACSRKVHCVAKGYLHDSFVRFFERDTTVINSPLMNRGTWLRTTAFENVVKHFADSHERMQVVSFGAGMDTLFFRLKATHNLAHVERYVEVDLPDMVEEKQRIIAQHDVLRELATDEHYRLVPADLSHPDHIGQIIAEHVLPDVPTILIAECVFIYVEEAASRRLLQSMLTAHFVPGLSVMFVSYDAILPNDRFGQMMIHNLAERHIELKSFKELPTCQAHVDRALAIGFKTASSVSMKALYLKAPKAEQQRLNALEMIDDWDEWNLVHDHYSFTVAWTNGDGTAASLPPVFDA
jgi:O-methyltransferase involved in polyketide biosynthesis